MPYLVSRLFPRAQLSFSEKVLPLLKRRAHSDCWPPKKAIQDRGRAVSAALWRGLRKIFVAALLGVSCPLFSWAGLPPWGAVGYSFYAANQTVAEVLGQFAASFSLSLQISPQVTGVVNGRFDEKNPSDFLDRLGAVYGFSWFTHGGTLFVSRAAEMTTRSFTASGSNILAMRKALSDLNILDQRFGWGELPAQGIVLVSGPPAYVKLVFDTVNALPLVSGGLQIAVFRLKHASVSDRTVFYRNKEVSTPGVAKILRSLITGGTRNAVYNDDAIEALAAPLRPDGDALKSTPSVSGDILSEPEGATPKKDKQAVGPSQASQGQPSIEADPRLNALIIQDAPERFPIYKKLIEQLDVPARLVEIEAMIIDVRSDRIDELGISWSARFGEINTGFGQMTSGNQNTSEPQNDIFFGKGDSGKFAGALGSGSSLIIPSAGNYILAKLHAMERVGDATIQSRPSVLTIDNIGAVLDLTETFYIKTEGERVATVTPVNTSTTLRVTPHLISLSGGGVVQLDVQIDEGGIKKDEFIQGYPITTNSMVNTQAIVGQGQTLLVGGHRNQTRSVSRKGLPFLSSIPVLGLLFSTRTGSAIDRQRLFLIRPRVVSLGPSFLKGGGDAIESSSILSPDPLTGVQRPAQSLEEETPSSSEMPAMVPMPPVSVSSRPMLTGEDEAIESNAVLPSASPTDVQLPVQSLEEEALSSREMPPRIPIPPVSTSPGPMLVPGVDEELVE